MAAYTRAVSSVTAQLGFPSLAVHILFSSVSSHLPDSDSLHTVPSQVWNDNPGCKQLLAEATPRRPNHETR